MPTLGETDPARGIREDLMKKKEKRLDNWEKSGANSVEYRQRPEKEAGEIRINNFACRAGRQFCKDEWPKAGRQREQ